MVAFGNGSAKTLLAAVLVLWAAGRAEGQCFASPQEAAAQSGRAMADGFELEGVMRDGVRGGLWAEVGQCGHPEWPVRLVAAPAAAVAPKLAQVARVRPRVAANAAGTNGSSNPAPGEDATVTGVVAGPAPITGELVVRAGATVLVVERTDQVRLEVAGVAGANGRVGERIQVRVGNQQLVSGTVRAGGWVEIE